LLGTNVRERFQTGRWGDYEQNESLRDERLAKATQEEESLPMHANRGSRAV
jgi:hypothetical protein